MEKDRVRPVDRSEFVGFPEGQRLVTTTSIWQNGSVPRTDGWPDYYFYVYAERPWDDAPAHLDAFSREWYEYIMTPPSATGHPSIGTSVWDNGPEGLLYEHTWICPRPIGALTITGITGGPGMSGIIAFTSLSGQTGSFDLRTGQWSFSPRTSVPK
jgi:hypothetical protein